MLDAGATLTTIMNPDLIQDVKVSSTPVHMSTCVGGRSINLEGNVPGMEDLTTWFDPNSKANVLSFSVLRKKCRIDYDYDNDCFNVHTEDGVVKFEACLEGLYLYKPSDKFLRGVAAKKSMESPSQKKPTTEQSHLVTTITENKKAFTARQFERAKRARRFYTILGRPGIQNLKHALRMNLIKDCPVTCEDVDLAAAIFGPDIGALKGRTTRKKPAFAKADYIEIPREILDLHQDIIWCMDVFFVNGMPELTGIDTSVRFRALENLKSRSADEFYKAIDNVFRIYNKAGFTISTIHCDVEFRPLLEKVMDNLDITCDFAPQGDHVPEAERNNRTIGERIRATVNALPHKALPRMVLQYIARVATRQLNMFPAKGGVSEYFSPHVIMKKQQLDYNKHFQVPIGAYVQGNHEPNPTNSNAPRSLDCLCLEPVEGKQGGHLLWHIATGRVINRPRVTEIPVTDTVNAAMEAAAKRDGNKSLKLTGKNKQPLPPAD